LKDETSIFGNKLLSSFLDLIKLLILCLWMLRMKWTMILFMKFLKLHTS